MSVRYEYRLRWERLGRALVTRIMQTERAAVEKAERMLALDEEKHVAPEGLDLHPLHDLPDMVSMSLERRPVGGWEQDRTFEVPEPDPVTADEGDPNAGIEAPW